MDKQEQIRQLQAEWKESPRWKGIDRTYSAEEVVKLRGTVQIEHTLARLGAVHARIAQVGKDMMGAYYQTEEELLANQLAKLGKAQYQPAIIERNARAEIQALQELRLCVVEKQRMLLDSKAD